MPPTTKKPAVKKTTGNSIEVLIDDREKYPMLFPRALSRRVDGHVVEWKIATRTSRLQTADYHILVRNRLVSVGERKSSIPEITVNLFGTVRRRRNFLCGLDRMADMPCPFVYLDMAWSAISHPMAIKGVPKIPAGHVLDQLLQECSIRRITVFGPLLAHAPTTRVQAADFLLRRVLTLTETRKPWTKVKDGIPITNYSPEKFLLTNPAFMGYNEGEQLTTIQDFIANTGDCNHVASSTTGNPVPHAGLPAHLEDPEGLASIVYRRLRDMPTPGDL